MDTIEFQRTLPRRLHSAFTLRNKNSSNQAFCIFTIFPLLHSHEQKDSDVIQNVFRVFPITTQFNSILSLEQNLVQSSIPYIFHKNGPKFRISNLEYILQYVNCKQPRLLIFESLPSCVHIFMVLFMDVQPCLLTIKLRKISVVTLTNTSHHTQTARFSNTLVEMTFLTLFF